MSGYITYNVPEYKWIKGARGTAPWPKNVRIVFPNGEVWDEHEGRDGNGELIADSDGDMAVGSPCHQALVALGLL